MRVYLSFALGLVLVSATGCGMQKDDWGSPAQKVGLPGVYVTLHKKANSVKDAAGPQVFHNGEDIILYWIESRAIDCESWQQSGVRESARAVARISCEDYENKCFTPTINSWTDADGRPIKSVSRNRYIFCLVTQSRPEHALSLVVDGANRRMRVLDTYEYNIYEQMTLSLDNRKE
jgi:hypothetical protein